MKGWTRLNLFNLLVVLCLLLSACDPPQAGEPISLPPSSLPDSPINGEAIIQGQENFPKYALVIGNAAYPEDPLNNPLNDATDIAQALTDLGFNVTLHGDLGAAAMETVVEEFSDRLPKGSVAAFFYAGHGIQVNGENYLIPVDAELKRERDAKREAFPLHEVMALMEDAETTFNILMIDACRDNPFYRRWNNTRGVATQPGLARADIPEGTFISFSTESGDFSEDGDGRNSPYTASLVERIRTKNMVIERMFSRVRSDVLATTENQQEPWYQASFSGDFFFNLDKGVQIANNDVAETEDVPEEPDPEQLDNSLERTPNISQDSVDLEGPSPGTPVPGPPPETPIPTQTQSAETPMSVRSQRVSFPSGTSAVRVANNVGPNQIKRYIINAKEGQILTLTELESQGGVTFDVILPNGQKFADATNLKIWSGFLPVSGDYAVDVKANQFSEFTLQIEATPSAE